MQLSTHQKFLLAFGAGTFLALFLLIIQIKKNTALTTSRVTEPLIAPNAVDIPIDRTEQLLGSPGAPLTLVAYLDMGSRFDRELYQTLTAAVRNHPKEMRMVFKHAPYESFWFQSTHTAVHAAILCADEQSKLWAFADQLAPLTTLWRNKQLTDTALNAKLDIAKFNTCLTAAETKARLAALVEQSKQITTDAPALFANNKKVNLETDIDLQALLESFITP